MSVAGLNSLQSGLHKQQMKDLFVELCLTVPVRLSSLLPYLPMLMDPLVSALNGSQTLISQVRHRLFLSPALLQLLPFPFNSCFWGEPRGLIYKISYDNVKVTIDLRRTSNLQNILQRAQDFSWVQFTCKIVRSFEIVFVNWLTISGGEILACCKSLLWISYTIKR